MLLFSLLVGWIIPPRKVALLDRLSIRERTIHAAPHRPGIIVWLFHGGLIRWQMLSIKKSINPLPETSASQADFLVKNSDRLLCYDQKKSGG
jgi:hypothetical protein